MIFFDQATQWISTGIEMIGIGIIVAGGIIASILFLVEWTKRKMFPAAYQKYRERLGQAILLGSNFLWPRISSARWLWIRHSGMSGCWEPSWSFGRS